MTRNTLKVLQIDGNALRHTRIASLLGEAVAARYHLDWTRSAEEGWRLAQRRQHDAVLVGDQLDGTTGLEWIRRANASGGSTAPLILLAGAGAKTPDAEAAKAGAAALLEDDDLRASALDRAIRQAIERRRLLAELRDRETHLNLILNTANLGFWDWNLATGEVKVTPEYKRLLGYTAEEPVFTGYEQWRDAVHPDDRALLDQAQRELTEGEDPDIRVIYRLRHRGGSYRWIQSRTLLMRDDARQPVRMIGTVYDVTERIETEKQLRDQAAVLDQANDIILVSDLEHRFLYCNQSAAHELGLEIDEIKGHTVTEVMGEVPTQYYDAFKDALQRGDWRGELTYKIRDGRPLTVEARWTLLRDDTGQPKALLTINADVTEKKRLEAQYLRAQRMESIGMLAGGIAHDLNNVLAPIVMATQLLRMRHADADSQKLLSTVEASAQRGADLVRQVLTFARGMEGQHLLVHPKALARDVEKLVGEIFDKSIEVATRIESDLWPVPGDPTQLHQVLMNLCVNSRDAMPHGGRLTLNVSNVRIDEQYAAMSPELRPGLYVMFEVQDTGTGMPPEVQRRIFEPFFSTKEPGKGTGLGLSTALTIVKNHDGFITFTSEPGQGTSFKVYLPASTETAIARGTAAGTPPPRGNGETILVVDDEASILSISRHALETFGYHVLTATNGAEALALFAQKRDAIAAVLTDMAMPVLDGAALIYALRRIDPAVKVIAASGLKASVQSMEPFGLGSTCFLAKPFTADTMLQAIHVAIHPPPPEETAPAVPAGSAPAVPTAPESATPKSA